MTSEQEIRALLRQYHVRPNRLRGQNFLIDDAVYEAIIDAAHLKIDDVVLEVGPGLGTLTERLAQKIKRIVAVEVEPAFVKILQDRFQRTKKIEVVLGDIRTAPEKDFRVPESYKVVSNIPYYLTGVFFRKFLTSDTQPISITVLVQREVAERLVAAVGELSLLALSVQLYSTPRLVRVVSSASFYPAPKVESAVVHLSQIHLFPYSDIQEKFFWRVARVGFSSPRKQIKNNIQAGFPALSSAAIAKIFSAATVSPMARAQDLSLDDWHRLSFELCK